MIALRLAMRCMPIDSTIVTIAGSPSGIADTASDTLVMKISRTGMRFRRPMTKITAQAAIATKPSVFPSFASFNCSGVAVSSAPSRRSAIFPISVFMPVAVTTARARP